MTHPHLLDPIIHAHGDEPFALACLGLILSVSIFILFRSIYRLARLTVDEIDEAETQGEI
jgi:hypothetical protein